MRLLVFAVVVAVSSSARADDHAQARSRLIEAVNKRDYKTVESLVASPLYVEKVRFTAEACRKFWGAAVVVRSNDLHALVDCLATQRISALADATTDAVYGPGFPLAIAFNPDGQVEWLRSESAPGSKPLRIEPTTFASHVTTLSRVVEPSPETQHAMEVGGAKAVRAELSLCVDESGATVPVATVAERALNTYAQDVAAAARAWKIEPFQLDGKPVLACAVFLVGYPAASLDQPLASTHGPYNGSPDHLESLRIRGSINIQPDDQTKKKFKETAAKKMIGSFKYCIDTKGAVSSVSVIKPTGYDAYDQKIQRVIKDEWGYKPYVVAGTAVPVCTAVVFIYDGKSIYDGT